MSCRKARSGKVTTVREYGEADAFGHRKKANVAEDFSDEIKKRTGEETVVSDLTYDLRSGAPDFTDKLVATTFGNMAYDAIQQQKRGLMAAIVDGRYAMAAIPDPKLGPRKVDIATMFNIERYRPSYANKEGMPVFLTQAVNYPPFCWPGASNGDAAFRSRTARGS